MTLIAALLAPPFAIATAALLARSSFAHDGAFGLIAAFAVTIVLGSAAALGVVLAEAAASRPRAEVRVPARRDRR